MDFSTFNTREKTPLAPAKNEIKEQKKKTLAVKICDTRVSGGKMDICDDCRTPRDSSELRTENACASGIVYGGCCHKTVCATACSYQCPECEATLTVEHEGWLPDNLICDSCLKPIDLHFKWHGISYLEWERRNEDGEGTFVRVNGIEQGYYMLKPLENVTKK